MRGKTCFLCGIGGSGMSALAHLLRARGWEVSGSDRGRDRGETPEKFKKLEEQGIKLYPQDGTGISVGMGMLAVSSAVEDTVPDVRAAKEKNIPIRKRAEVLAEFFNEADFSIAIGGTSGKSTVTAMTGWILHRVGKNPMIVNGAGMVNFEGRNCVVGKGPFVAEVDESDGSIALFNPSVAVLTNISLDHKPVTELESLFGAFTVRSKKALVGGEAFSLDNPEAEFFARDIVPFDDGVSFAVKDISVHLRVPGRHNVANALAAIAAAQEAGVNLKASAEALFEYKGIHRRFEITGAVCGITVIDDFAHNPDKIAATLRTLHERSGRVWIVFQPHGFGPTKLMRAALVDMFEEEMGKDDILLMPEIYYAGGTAARDISSADIIAEVWLRQKRARFFERRDDIVPYIAALARPGDRIIVMGARDDTLPAFAAAIISALDIKGIRKKTP